jgi:hypothetical protein
MKLEDITTIDELKDFVGDDELTEEEWMDLINFVLSNDNSDDKNKEEEPK